MATLVSTGQLTIADSNDGLAAMLTNDSTVLAADSGGVVSSFAGANTQMRVYLGGQEVTTQCVFYVSAVSNVTYRDSDDVADRSATGSTSGLLSGTAGYLSVTSLSADIGYVDITATKTGWSDVTKRYSLAKSKQGSVGSAAQYVVVTSEQVFKYPTGASTPTNTTITVSAALFGGLTTYQWQYWNGSAWANLGGTSTTSTYAMAYNNAAFTGNSLRCRCLSGTAYDEVTLVKVYDGAAGSAGSAGAPGLSAITVVLSNETAAVPSASDGSSPSFAGTGFTVRVYEGSTLLDYDGSGLTAGKWAISLAGSSVTPGTASSTGTTPNRYATVSTITAMSADQGAVTVTVTGRRADNSSISVSATQNVFKAKAGAVGATGSAGAAAQYVVVTAQQVFQYAANTSTASPTSITLTAALFGGLSGYSWQYWNGSTWTALAAPAGNATYTLGPGPAQTEWGTAKALRVRCLSGTAYDELTIVKVYDGVDDVTVLLSNEMVAVPTNSAGGSPVLTGTGTVVKVYEGATLLDYDGVGTVAGTWNVTSAGTSVTPGTKASTGTTPNRYVTYPNITAIAADTGYTTYTISGTRRNGTTFSGVTKVQNYSKTRAGVDGVSVAEVGVYIRSATAPATPTGGSYDFSTTTLTPPASWSSTIPAGSDPLYQSRGVAAVSGATGVDSTITWSAPGKVNQDGSALDIVFQRSAAAPAAPAPSAGVPAGWYSSVGLVPASIAPLWSSVGYHDPSDAVNWPNWVWDTPVRVDADSPLSQSNLIRNGDGGAGNNTNFTGVYPGGTSNSLVYVATGGPDNGPIFQRQLSLRSDVYSDELVRVVTDDLYEMGVYLKTDAVSSTSYWGYQCFRADGTYIDHADCWRVPGATEADGTTPQIIAAGTNFISWTSMINGTLNTALGALGASTGLTHLVAHKCSSDAAGVSGSELPITSASRKSLAAGTGYAVINAGDNGSGLAYATPGTWGTLYVGATYCKFTIGTDSTLTAYKTLNSLFQANDFVQFSQQGSMFHYFWSGTTPSTWTLYKGRMTGVNAVGSPPSPYAFRRGTAFIRFGALSNYSNVPSATSSFAKIYARVVEGSLSGYLTNDSVALPATEFGVVSSYATATGQFKVFYGAVDVTTSCTFSETADPQALDPNPTINASTGAYAVTGGFDSGESTASVTYRATYSVGGVALTLDKVFTLTKAVTGTTGPRAPRNFVAAGSAWSDTTANNAITTAGYTKMAQDTVTITDGTFTQTKFWDGSAWTVATSTIDGNLLITGTLYVDRLKGDVSKFLSLNYRPASPYLVLTTAGTEYDVISTVLPASDHPLGHTPTIIANVAFSNGAASFASTVRMLRVSGWAGEIGTGAGSSNLSLGTPTSYSSWYYTSYYPIPAYFVFAGVLDVVVGDTLTQSGNSYTVQSVSKTTTTTVTVGYVSGLDGTTVTRTRGGLAAGVIGNWKKLCTYQTALSAGTDVVTMEASLGVQTAVATPMKITATVSLQSSPAIYVYQADAVFIGVR